MLTKPPHNPDRRARAPRLLEFPREHTADCQQHPRGHRPYADGPDQPHHRGVVTTTVLAKIETFNPGNSIKDRMAVRMIEDAERAGLLKPGGTIIEGTSGNTGMGLAIAAVVKGYKCIFTTTDKQSKEKVDALKAFGAEVIVCPTNVDPEDPRSYYSVSSRLEQEVPNSWKANQYDNLSNSRRPLRADRARRSGSRPTAGSPTSSSASAPAAPSPAPAAI